MGYMHIPDCPDFKRRSSPDLYDDLDDNEDRECPNCGAPCPDDEDRCKYCRTKLKRGE